MAPLWATISAAVVLAAYVAFNLVAWQAANLVLPLASGLLLISVIYVLNMTYGFFVESRGKRQLAGLFGQYVPPELVDEMAKNPEAISLEGESREMTVLFSDVRGFTSISEGLDPKQLTQLMNDLAREGWEYLRADTLPCEERSGLTGKSTTFQNLLVFRRVKTAPVTAAAPAIPGLGSARAGEGAAPALGPAPSDQDLPKASLRAE